MEDYSKYIKKELRDGSIDTEYDGYLKNLHPTKTFYVKCTIQKNISSDKVVVIKMPPLSKQIVISHNCGPVLENDLDFSIVRIYTKKPKEN